MMIDRTEYSRKLEDLPDYSTRQELSGFTRVSVQTLARWTVEGKGPRVTKLGGAVRYAKADVLTWLEQAAA